MFLALDASRDELFEFIPADADNAEDIVSHFFYINESSQRTTVTRTVMCRQLFEGIEVLLADKVCFHRIEQLPTVGFISSWLSCFM